MTPEFFDLTLEVQIAIGGGFLAYCTAYAGLRRHHTNTETFMISLAFGLVGVLAFRLSQPPLGEAVSAVTAVLAALLAGAFWRVAGQPAWQRLMAWAGVHQDDGSHAAWEALIQQRRLSVTQVAVRLKSGREMSCSRAGAFRNGPAKGLILGGDGSIVMVVEDETTSDGEAQPRTAIQDENFGTRLTYVPKSEIEFVELRCL